MDDMNELKNRYDYIGEFYQGVAIVVKNNFYGDIMVGGKEIVPPIYDDLSEFENGCAVAKWNNEERVINLSGQIRVLKGNKEIFCQRNMIGALILSRIFALL